MDAALEQRLEAAFEEGFERWEASKAGSCLQPMGSRETETEEGRARVFGEWIIHETVDSDTAMDEGWNQVDVEDFEILDFAEYLGESFRTALSSSLRKNRVLHPNWKVLLSVVHHAENRYGWMQENLLSKEGIFETILGGGKVSRAILGLHNFEDKMISWLPEKLHEAYEKHFPGSAYHLKTLAKAVAAGKADADRALQVHKDGLKQSEEIAEYSAWALGTLAAAVPPGKFDDVIEVCEGLVDRDIDYAVAGSRGLEELAKAAPPEKIGRVIALFEKCISEKGDNMASGAARDLGALAEAAPPEKMEEVAGLFRKCIDLYGKPAMKAIDNFYPLARALPPEKVGLLFGLYEQCKEIGGNIWEPARKNMRALASVVPDEDDERVRVLFNDEGESPEIDEYSRTISSLSEGISTEQDIGMKIKFLRKQIRKGGKPAESAATKLGWLAKEASPKQMGKVIGLYKRCMKAEGETADLTVRRLGDLVNAISGMNAGRLAKWYRMRQAFGMYRKCLKKWKPWAAAKNLGAFAEEVPAELMDDVIGLFEICHSCGHSIVDSAAHSLNKLAKIAPAEKKGRIAEIFRRYALAGTKESEEPVAAGLGNLTRWMPPEHFDRVLWLYEQCLRKGGKTVQKSASALGTLAESAPKERIGDVISMFERYVAITARSKSPRYSEAARRHANGLCYVGTKENSFFDQLQKKYLEALLSEETRCASIVAESFGALACSTPPEKIDRVFRLYSYCIEKGDTAEQREAVEAARDDTSRETWEMGSTLLRELHSKRMIAGTAAGALGQLAEAAPEERMGDVIALYEKCLEGGNSAAESSAQTLGPLAEAAPAHLLDDVMRLTKKYMEMGGVIANNVSKHLNIFAGLANSGKVKLEETLALYDLAFEHGAVEGAAESLPRFAGMFPEEAVELYRKAHEAALRKSDVLTSDGLSETRRLISNSLRSNLSSALHYGKIKRCRKELTCISLALDVEARRIGQLEAIYSHENRARPIPDGEIIHDYVQKYCRHLKGDKRNKMRDFLIDRPGFTKTHEHLKMEGGYSSEAVIDFTGDVVKTATTAQNEREDLVYSLEGLPDRFCVLEDNLLGEFGMFIPRKRGELIRLNDGMSLLVLDDLRKREPGQKIAEMMYKALTGEYRVPWQTENAGHNAAIYNMFLLGIAHKCLTKAANDLRAEFPESQYTTLTGIPHYRAIKEPLPNTSERVYQEMMRPVDRTMIGRCGKIIDKFIEHARKHESKAVTVGDNKILENMINGYMHDFACVGWGLEIEDITYGLVEPRLGIPLQNIKYYVEAYTKMRCLHDEDFRADVMKGKGEEILAMTGAATLKALSIYASCTRKRVEQMESGEIVPRRNFFIDAMQFMLENGDFTAVGVGK